MYNQKINFLIYICESYTLRNYQINSRQYSCLTFSTLTSAQTKVPEREHQETLNSVDTTAILYDIDSPMNINTTLRVEFLLIRLR